MQLSFHPRVWLNPVLPALWPIEREMFLAAISQEEENLAEILRSQTIRFNFACRYEEGREVFFYNVEFGIFESDRGTKIDASQWEVPWVEFVLKLRSGASIKAKFYLIDGTACYIRYSTKTNRHMVKGATITKMKRLSWDQEAIAAQNPTAALGLAEELETLAREPIRSPGFARFMSPKEAYEVALVQGDFVAIGELPDEGIILAHLGSDAQKRGIYLGLYDQEEVEFIAKNLDEAVVKLNVRATAPPPPA